MTLNVVVIGTGFGKRAAAPVYTKLGCNVKVVSPRESAHVEQLLADNCDLVSIHSPPFMHLEHVELAVKHGCHVLCDKPFGRNLSDAQAMLERVTEAGVRHFLNFEFRFDPLRQQMKQLIAEGAIGQPQHLTSNMFIARGADTPHGWLFEKEKGGGWIGAFVSHEIDALHWLFGDFEAFHAFPRQDVIQRQGRDGSTCQATAEDAMTACLRMHNGVTATIDTAFAAAVNLPVTLTVFGSLGAIQITNNTELCLMQKGQEPQYFKAPAEDNALMPAMEQWLTRVCNAITSGQALAPDFHDGVVCVKVLDALRS